MFYKLLVISTLLVASSCFNLTESEKEENKKYAGSWFHCGSEEAAMNKITSCPGAILDLNHCCAIHNDCYDQQLNKTTCDTEFVECNQRAETKRNEDCDIHLLHAQLAVEKLGHGTHKAAETKNYTGPYYVSEVDQLSSLFFSLFQKSCEKHKIVYASCAFNYDSCLQSFKVTVMDCRRKVIQCVLDVPNEDTRACSYTKSKFLEHIQPNDHIYSGLHVVRDFKE